MPATSPDERPTTSSSTHRVHAPSPGTTAGDGPSRPNRWLVPLLALLLGTVLGASLAGLLGAGEDDPDDIAEADSTPTPTATVPVATATAGQLVIPGSCVEIADESGRLNRVLVEGVAAARDLDASTMSAVVREFGSVQTRLQQLSEECRAGANAPGMVTATPTADATDTPSGAEATATP